MSRQLKARDRLFPPMAPCRGQTLVNATDSPTGFPYCQYPLRTNLAFPQLKTSGIRHVLVVDQVGGRRGRQGRQRPPPPRAHSCMCFRVRAGTSGWLPDVPALLSPRGESQRLALCTCGCALGLGVFHARRQLGLTAVSVAVFAVVCARCVGAVACSPVGMVPTFKPL